MRNSLRTQAGFTLVELLVVITIVALLAGMVAMGVPRVLDGARRADAAATITSLQIAWAAYQQEYSKFPSVVREDETIAPEDAYTILANRTKNPNAAILETENPRGTVYLTLDSKKLDKKDKPTKVVDPWKKPFVTYLDANYDSVLKILPEPKAGLKQEEEINKSLAIYSFGSPGKNEGIFSWK